MKIIVSGAHGLIGSALCTFLNAKGNQVLTLSRGFAADANSVRWDPEKGRLDKDKIEGVQAVVHLAGESVAQRWTDAAKTRIMESRRKGTRLLSETIASLKDRPEVFVSASAIGYYGSRGSETLSETSTAGNGFLAEVCKTWEEQTNIASSSGIRTINLRIGVVLSKKGGALAKMLPVFQFGLGGVLGEGNQYMSWISLDDLVEAIYFAISQENLSGPLNAVAPNPVTNRQFTDALSGVLKRPAILPVPSFGARLLMGQMADEMLLSGARVVPAKLQESGFKFQYTSIESALKHELLG